MRFSALARISARFSARFSAREPAQFEPGSQKSGSVRLEPKKNRLIDTSTSRCCCSPVTATFFSHFPKFPSARSDLQPQGPQVLLPGDRGDPARDGCSGVDQGRGPIPQHPLGLVHEAHAPQGAAGGGPVRVGREIPGKELRIAGFSTAFETCWSIGLRAWGSQYLWVLKKFVRY